MVEWHLPLAISGQDANLPASSLTFAPKVPVPYRLPVLLPGVVGQISASAAEDGAMQFTLTLAFGELTLDHLAVNGSAYPSGPVTIRPGAPATWRA